MASRRSASSADEGRFFGSVSQQPCSSATASVGVSSGSDGRFPAARVACQLDRAARPSGSFKTLFVNGSESFVLLLGVQFQFSAEGAVTANE